MTCTAWPLFDLVIRTPRLELRIVREADALELIELADHGIHDPATMPFAVPWTDVEAPERWYETMRWFGRSIAECRPGDFRLPFALRSEGVLVGVQDLLAPGFDGSRSVETGSWLGREHQGRGLGYEARIAALTVAFDHLGARCAATSGFADNVASLRVTEKADYLPNGESLRPRRGEPARMLHFLLTAERWAEVRPELPVSVDGFEGCRGLLGI